MPVANPAGDMLRGSSQWRGGSMMCAFPNADCTSGYATPRPPQPNSLASGCKTVACGARAQCASTWSVHDRCRVLPMPAHVLASDCSPVFSTPKPGPQQQRHLPLETAHRLQCDTPPVRALNLWSRRHGDVITRHMRNATIAPPCKARPNEAARRTYGWPCPAHRPCALHPIAHCSLSITIECAGSATFTVLPLTRAPLNATGATACGCA